MNHTIAVVAHTSRAERAHRLMQDTQASYLSMDDGTLGCEGNHYRAWEWLRDFSGCQWSVVLEDDTLPVPGFGEQLHAALAAAPSPVASLYLGRQRPPHWQPAVRRATEQADGQDACYITGTHLLHAVAVAIRTDLLSSMLAHTMTTHHPWDYRIAAWALSEGHRISYTWPSLCEHLDCGTVVKHPDGKPRPPGRVAWRTGVRERWSDRTVPITP